MFQLKFDYYYIHYLFTFDQKKFWEMGGINYLPSCRKKALEVFAIVIVFSRPYGVDHRFFGGHGGSEAGEHGRVAVSQKKWLLPFTIFFA